MIVQPPKTIDEFLEVRKTCLELMGNPYCDEFMFRSLSDKIDLIDKEIIKLKLNSNTP